MANHSIHYCLTLSAFRFGERDEWLSARSAYVLCSNSLQYLRKWVMNSCITEVYA